MADRPIVLIVEDEALVLDVAALEFEDAGFDVLTASDSAEALTQLEGPAPIDLLFTDIRLPGGMDGWSLARRARTLRPDIPIIYATGYSAEPPQIPARARLFTKPYRLSEILAAARALL